MSGNIHVNIFIYKDDAAKQGYALGHICIQDCALHFMESDLISQLEQLRDECQRQIGEINLARTGVGVLLDRPENAALIQAGQTEPLPANAPAEELAAPFISAASPLEGQPSPDAAPEKVIVPDDYPDVPF